MSHTGAKTNEEKYDLELLSFPDESALVDACRLLYRSTDEKLLASMNSTPYLVGRSFSSEDFQEIHQALARLGVKHRFTERLSGRKIEFSESRETTSNQLEKKKPKKLPWKMALLLLVFSGLISLLFVNWSFKQEDQEKPMIDAPSKQENTKKSDPISPENYQAELSRLQNKVEVRSSNELSWKEARENQKLQARDSIKTSAESSASLLYRSGSLVSILPNSLVVVGRSTENSQTQEDKIELSNGDLNARLQKTTQRKVLNIETEQGQIQMNSELGSVQLRTSVTNGQLKIQVAKGSANFEPKKPSDQINSKTIELKEYKQISFEPDGNAILSDYKPSIRLISPVPESHVKNTDGETQVFNFEWENLGAGTNYEFIVSSSEQLAQPLIRQSLTDSSIELTYLDSGKLYWGVRAELDNVVYTSPVWSLHVE